MNKTKIVLASTSTFRRSLLDRLGIAYEAVNPNVDENTFKRQIRDPQTLVLELAKAKALAVAHRFPDAIVIGSDQCAAIDEHILDKPETQERACEQLARLSGREHVLYTAICVVNTRTDVCRCELDTHRMRMRSLSSEQILLYVQKDEPLLCAGSYKIESLGVALFEQVEGLDATAIVGLPLMRLVKILAEQGVDVLAPR